MCPDGDEVVLGDAVDQHPDEQFDRLRGLLIRRGRAGFVRLVISVEKELVEVGDAEADRAPTDLQRDSRIGDVMVGRLPPTNQEEQSTADRQ